MSERNLGRFFGELWRKDADQTVLYGSAGGALEPWAAGKALALVTRLGAALQPETLEREGLSFAPLVGGTRVLLAVQSQAEALLLALAAWSVGAVTIHLAPGLPEGLLEQALERMKADVVLVDSRQTLGGLELASDAAVGRSSVILLEGAPVPAVPRMLGWAQLLELGTRHRAVRMEQLARLMFAVPPDARAAILYWAEGAELKATALTHGELLGALPALPRSWGLAPSDPIFSTLPLGDREALLWTLRALAHRQVLAPAGPGELAASVAAVAPRALWTDAPTLELLLDGLDRAEGDLSVRGALKRSLDWLETRKGGASGAGQLVTAGLGGWAERGLASMLRRDLGGRLRLIYCLGKAPGAEAAALLQAAGVELAGGR